jgi:diadenylate cyclase
MRFAGRGLINPINPINLINPANLANLTNPVLSWLAEALGRPTLGWRDVLDIALVSLLIYEALILIRGTRAVQMAVGAGLAVALFYLSQIVQLETVNWLIRNLVGYVFFAIIVLFQSDIRRALAHLGRAPFFRYLAKGETVDETVEEIAVAAQMLSSQRTGAIIALERQIGLRNYVEGGIPLDAKLSYDLLVTIFQPGSPLHDGAVIVQENRVAAAACFLPLTVNPRLSKDLGTRHRAAIGLTEVNDAVAVVVSEETGWISLVLEGRIERNITPDRLRTRLRQLLRPRQTPDSPSVPASPVAI